MHSPTKKKTILKNFNQSFYKMKKIININLSGRVIPIEDSAYESLQRYIESLRRYFANEEGRDEIINDIESRIAELMNDKVRKGATAVTDADMEEIISSMGRVEDFEKTDAEEEKASATSGQASGTYTQTQSEPRRAKGRLYRDGSDKFLGGVCAGIANYMNVDPAIVRLIFAIITFGGFGTGIIIYLALWIILPVKYLDTYVGKRLFRNPDDRVISGVAGGLGAYFNKPSWAFRLIFAAPLLLNILFGVLNGVFFMWQRDIFPNIFIGSFSGTFVLAYIILWIVLPEARSPFEKMEMRGEKVDVNRIRQNVKEEMNDFKNKMQNWGEEVKQTAQTWTKEAKEYANVRSKTAASEFTEMTRPSSGQGCLHAIGVIIKAFFIFIAGCITLSLFAAFMAILFGGVAWWPINNFLWTSSIQKALAWGTLIFFIGVPIIGFMTWLIRRIVRTRSHSRYLGWIFGGLWTLGWVCAIFFAVSIAKDLREYEKVTTDVSLIQPASGKLIVNVNEPEIRYSGGFGWLRHDNTGWDMTEDTLKYNNVKFRISKSEDSLYHATISKYSFGSSIKDAQTRAERIVFNVSNQDSTINLGSGLTVDRNSKFRGQGVIMEIQVPVGKRIRFDESLVHAYNPWVVRRGGRDYRYWNRRYDHNIDWDYDDYFDWDADVDYVMTTDGKLIKADKIVIDSTGVYEKKSDKNKLKELEEKEKKNERERQEIEREKQRLQDQQKPTDSNSTGQRVKDDNSDLASVNFFTALII
jgi:phage shock protein PspC (stress-responsive transcriptional regulator)